MLSEFVHVSAALTTAVSERLDRVGRALACSLDSAELKSSGYGSCLQDLVSNVLSRDVWEPAKSPKRLCKIMRLTAYCNMQTNTGMNGDWNPSMWQLANELAGLGLRQGAGASPSLDHKAPHSFGWVQAADEHLEPPSHQRYSSMPLDDSSAKGWGGQASHCCIARTSSRRTRIFAAEIVANHLGAIA